MAIETAVVKINGKDETLEIENDPPWGKIQEILEQSLKKDGSFNWQKFLQLLLEISVKSFTAFPITDRTRFNSLPGTEATAILGEVKKRIPLETYSKNLGFDIEITQD